MGADNKVLATRGKEAAEQLEFINKKLQETNPALKVNNSNSLKWLINSYYNLLKRTNPTKIDVNQLF